MLFDHHTLLLFTALGSMSHCLIEILYFTGTDNIFNFVKTDPSILIGCRGPFRRYHTTRTDSLSRTS